METTYKLKGVIFSRAWWVAATEELKPADRLAFYDAVLSYAFTDEVTESLPAAVRAMFAMVRPFLDEDKVKYNERVERNRKNAMGGKRVAASGSESQPVATNTNTNNNTNTNTNTNTISVNEEREKWLVFGYFWSSGSGAVQQETAAFWSYYESLGWKNNKGAAIVNRLACARMWRRQYENKEAPAGADAWFKVLQGCDIYDYSLYAAYMGAERVDTGVVVRLRCSEQWEADFRAKCAGVLPALARLWRVPAVTISRVR